MTPGLRTPGPASPSTWLSIAIGLAALAATLKPFHVSSAVFWLVLGLGGVSRSLPRPWSCDGGCQRKHVRTRSSRTIPSRALERRRVSAAVAGIEAGSREHRSG